jgi:hypothetical protein
LKGEGVVSEIGFGQDMIDIKRIKDNTLNPVETIQDRKSVPSVQEPPLVPFARPAPRLVTTKNDWYENQSTDSIGDMRKAALNFKSQMARDSYTRKNGESTAMTDTISQANTNRPEERLNRLAAMSKLITG